MEDQLFYKTTTYEESPQYLVRFANESEPRMMSSKGEATIYTLKDNVYRTLKEIIRVKGSLSHYPRKTYKLDYGNGSDLPEFQESNIVCTTNKARRGKVACEVTRSGEKTRYTDKINKERSTGL